MRKILLWALIFLSLFSMSGCKKEKKTYNDPYNREAAVAYSYQYATGRNPEYADFQNNCTNYISQILVAGGKEMDDAIPPKTDRRITYHKGWFSSSMETQPKRWKEFSVGTAFCRTKDFIEYWNHERGMELLRYNNTVAGLKELYDKADAGDIIVLYNEKEEAIHLCFLAKKENLKLLVNANTIDYYEHNIMEISPQNYPAFGLLKIK